MVERKAPGEGAPAVPRRRGQRSFAVGGLAATRAARTVHTKLAMVGRTEEARAVLAEQSALRSAEQLVDVLGKLKGGSMKVGQMLSVLDPGLLPEDRREEFRQRLEALCSYAEPLDFASMVPVIERDLGPLGSSFLDFDPNPIGVASIGQVYRAILRSGREVAVKVKYPGIEEAIHSDIRNLKLFGKMFTAQWPTVRDGTLFDEIARNLRTELDYRAEARTQASVAEYYAGHPYFTVPNVIGELCTDDVLVTEFVAGSPFSTATSLPQAERDLIGELVFRFYVGSLFERNEFCADPHFGNVLVLPDQRLCMLDYGQYHHMDVKDVARERALLRAACDNDGDSVRSLLVEAGVFDAAATFSATECLQYIRGATEWTVTDGTLRITTEAVTTAFLLATDPRMSDHAELRRQTLPPTHLASRRVEFLAMGMIGRIESEANWHRIAREWIYREPPITDVGRHIDAWGRHR